MYQVGLDTKVYWLHEGEIDSAVMPLLKLIKNLMDSGIDPSALGNILSGLRKDGYHIGTLENGAYIAVADCIPEVPSKC